MKNKKGFTTVELVSTFALTMVVVVLLLQIVVILKNIYVNQVMVSSLRLKQGYMTEHIMDDFDNKTMTGAYSCGTNCVTFAWDDGTTTNLSIDKRESIFNYGDYSTTLMAGSSFDDLNISYSQDMLSSTHGYLIVSIPVSTSIATGNYGIRVVYQYTNPFNKGELVIDNDNSLLELIGSNEMKVGKPSDYTEPGWRTYKNKVWVDNDSSVIVSYSHDSNSVTGIQSTGTTLVTYTYLAEDGATYIQQRKVTILPPAIMQNWTYNNTDTAASIIASAVDFHDAVYYQKIKNVTFESSVNLTNLSAVLTGSKTTTTYWDISDAKDNSVVAWLTDNATSGYYDLHIGSNGTDGIVHAKDLGYLFAGFNNIETINIAKLDTTNTTKMNNIFSNCTNLVSLDLSTFNTSKVTNMYHMFYNCNKLTTLDVSKFDTSNVTDMSFMFFRCSAITTLDVSNFNTSNVTNMSSMFDNCSSLTTLDVSNFNTSNVTNMNSMFSACKLLNSLNVTNFNTASVTNMGQMFYYCRTLTTLDISNWNTAKVTDMSWLFGLVNHVKVLDVSKWNTSSATNMERMFYATNAVTTLNVSSFNTSKVTNMCAMFNTGYIDLVLTSITFGSGWDTSKVTNMTDMFRQDGAITALDISMFDMSSVTSYDGMFTNDTGLTTLVTPKVGKTSVTLPKTMYDLANSNTAYTTLPTTTKTLYSTIKYIDPVLNGADPVLTDGMIPVIISDNGTVTKADESTAWYDYTNKLWANMVLIKDSTKRATYASASAGTTITQSDIAAYYVWIPRYKYAITTGSGSRLINVVFESSTTTKSSGNAVGTNYLTHPAFTFGTEETNGFWFAKFETTGDTTTPTILPGVTSLRSQNVSTQFTTSQKFANYLVTSASADSHMSKNSEWGAVAYLVNSLYGRYNSSSTCIASGCEVWINNVSGYITGCVGTSVSAASVSATACPSGYDWKTAGVNASTNGNISGIYDMSGGALEYVMGDLSGSLGSSGFSTLPNAKYYQTYTGSALATACNGSVCYGDAMSETAGWNGAYAEMVNTTSPWFRRGGYFGDGTSAGVFYVYGSSGGAYGYGSFRAVLVP